MSACDCGHKGLMPVDEAIAHLLATTVPVSAIDTVALDDASGRVLAESVAAPFDVPAYDDSAMDGYALRHADLTGPRTRLTVAGVVAAGETAPAGLPPGSALRIFTGALLPPGADTVVPQEVCHREDEYVWVPAGERGSHVRRRGEELVAGEPLFAAGDVITPPVAGMLGSMGIASVRAFKRLRVGIFSTGDELRQPGEPILPGQRFDANRSTLRAVLHGWGMSVIDYPCVVDDYAAVEGQCMQAAGECDVIITSGGVSVGDRDLIRQVIADHGEIALWRLAIQPGKPFAFGNVFGTPWLGLPGNPVAALITLLVVARPMLLKLAGRSRLHVMPLPVVAGFTWSTPNARRQYLRVGFTQRDHGIVVVPFPKQGSAMLSSACQSDGLAIVEAGDCVEVGETVGFLPFAQLMATGY